MPARKILRKFNWQTLVIILAIGNILILDILVISRFFPGFGNVLGVTSGSEAQSCPQACIDRINRISSPVTGTKEYYVPLGSGSSSASDWADVTGSQAYIDSALYGKTKEVTFEATIYVPTGNQTVWVRLFNATDKHPVWFSELSMNGSGPTLLTSKPINLDTGNKLYVVQIKTQLKSPASLQQSRIHILTK